MKKHTKVYLKHFNFQIPEDCYCEVCKGNGLQTFANDVHHINGRGLHMDEITNLIAVCRDCHTDIHHEKLSKEQVQSYHNEFMLAGGELF